MLAHSEKTFTGSLKKSQRKSQNSMSIGSLLWNIPEEYSVDDPVVFRNDVDDAIPFDATLQNDGTILVQVYPTVGSAGIRKLFTVHGQSYEQELTNIRHEIVSSMCEGETDVPFWEMMGLSASVEPWDKLTPDYACTENSCVGELGTSFVSSEDVLRRQYAVKVAKYATSIVRAGIERQYTFIVSPQAIISNYPLQPHQVRIFTARMRLGMNIESKIETLLGWSPFKGIDESKADKRVRQIVESLTLPPLEDYPEEVDFNPELTEVAMNDVTDDERKKALEMLNNLWIESEIFVPQTEDNLNSWLDEHSDPITNTIGETRVCPFPLVVHLDSNDESDMTVSSSDTNYLPPGLRPVWDATWMNAKFQELMDVDEEIVAEFTDMRPEEHERHKNRRIQSFTPLPFSPADEEYNHMAGLFAKGTTNPAVLAHQKERKKSVSMNSDVKDIEEFVYGDSLTSRMDGLYTNEAMPLMEKAKELSSDSTPLYSSMSIYKEFVSATSMSVLGHYITDLMLELSLSISTYNKGKTFSLKRLNKHKAWIVVHNSGNMVWFSAAFQKVHAKPISRGKLGPKMFTTKNFTISDWCCLSKEQIEHYLKAQAVLESIIIHALSVERVDITKNIWDQIGKHSGFWAKIKLQLLQFLANKRCSETVVTTTRYLYMNVLDINNKDPFRHVQNFPDVLRSRLTVFLIKKVIRAMRVFCTKSPVLKIENETFYFTNLIDWRTMNEFSFEEAVDSFYHGYLSSKDRAVNAHSSFKICSKLFKEEYNYRKHLEKGGLPFGEDEVPVRHSANRILFKYVLQVFRELCEKRVGSEYKELFAKSFITKLRRFTFNDASTLKASGRVGIEELQGEILDEFEHDKTKFRQAQSFLKDRADLLYKSRHRVLEGINELVSEYMRDEQTEPQEYVDLLPYCMKRLEESKGFDSDLFPKSQHEKDREIHVLTIHARVPQSVIEMLSKAICEFFPSETITHPEQKLRFVRDHYSAAGLTFGEFVTFCKSADATTWCQNHHATRFAAMLIAVTPGWLHPMIYRILLLWVRKRVTIPASLIANFLANRKLAEAPDLWRKIRDECLTRKGLFQNASIGTANVRSGMFQGILHYTSSLMHTIYQEVMKEYEKAAFESLTGGKMVVTKAQGSDDSASMNSFRLSMENKARDIRVAKRVMRYKERVAEMIGIIDSRKTASCIPFILEYNSEWFIRERSVKPTFRWVASSSTLTVNETFVSRYQQFSNLLTQVLESGGSTLECALLQLAQATLHYKLVGSSTNPLFRVFRDKMLLHPDPVLGFFPLSPDLTCGALGFDYDLYRVAAKTSLGAKLISLETTFDETLIEYFGQTSEAKKRMLRAGGKFSFVESKVWQKIMDRMRIMNKEEIIEKIDSDPEIVFGIRKDWASQQVTIALKMYSSGVRGSLNSRTPLYKMSAAASYMLNRRFIRTPGSGLAESLLHVMATIFEPLDEVSKEKSLQKSFPMLKQYRVYDQQINEAEANMIILEAEMRTRNRVVLRILESPLPGTFSLMELCKRKWFGKKYNLALGDTSFSDLWKEAKLHYSFIENSLSATRLGLSMSTLQVKVLLEGIYHKSRSIKLQDTASKSGSTFSSLLRVFWPGVRVTYLAGGSDYSLDVLLSNLFMLCAGPFLQSWSAEQCTRLLRDTDALDGVYQNGSTAHKLSLMRDSIRGTAPLALIEKIKATRLGIVGYFSIRQTNTNGLYSGFGEWRGVIGTTSIILHMEDTVLVKIIVSSLLDPDFLGRSLQTLTTELKIKSYKETPSNCSVYFTGTGKLRANGMGKNSMGVTLDSKLKVELLEGMKDMPLSIQTVEYGIRLCAQDPSGKSITLLSCPMLTSYWMPDARPLVGDWFFQQFLSDTPSILLTEFSKLPRGRNRRERGHLSGIRMRKLFLQELKAFERLKDEDRDLSTAAGNTSIEISERELDMYKTMISRNFDSVVEVRSWADEITAEEDDLVATLGLLEQETHEIQERLTPRNCGIPYGLRTLSMELNYRLSSSPQNLARDLLIDNRTDLVMDRKVADFWSFVTGVPYRSYQGNQDLPPSLSAVSGAMSIEDITRNLAILESAGAQEIYAMRDALIIYQKKLLEALERRDKRTSPEERIGSQLKSRFWGKGGMRLCAGVVKLIDLLGLEERTLDEVVEFTGMTGVISLDILDRISEITELTVFVMSEGNKIMEFDRRPESSKEEDPDNLMHVELEMDDSGWMLSYMDPYSGLKFRWPPGEEDDLPEADKEKEDEQEEEAVEESESHKESSEDEHDYDHDPNLGSMTIVPPAPPAEGSTVATDLLQNIDWQHEGWSRDVEDQILKLPLKDRLSQYQLYLSKSEDYDFERAVSEAERSGAVSRFFFERDRLKMDGPIGKEVKWDTMHKKHETALTKMADTQLKSWQPTSGDGMLCLVMAANQATRVPAKLILEEARGYMELFEEANPGLCEQLGVTMESFFNVDLLLKLPCMAQYRFMILYKDNGKTKLIVKPKGSDEIAFIRNLNNVHYENLDPKEAEYQQENFQDMLTQWNPIKGNAMHTALIRELERRKS